MNVSTVYLKGPWAPGGKDYLSGYLGTRLNTDITITVSDRDDFRGKLVEFSLESIARIEHNTGWR